MTKSASKFELSCEDMHYNSPILQIVGILIAVTAGKTTAIVTQKQPAAHRCQKLKTQTKPEITAKIMAV